MKRVQTIYQEKNGAPAMLVRCTKPSVTKALAWFMTIAKLAESEADGLAFIQRESERFTDHGTTDRQMLYIHDDDQVILAFDGKHEEDYIRSMAKFINDYHKREQSKSS